MKYNWIKGVVIAGAMAAIVGCVPGEAEFVMKTSEIQKALAGERAQIRVHEKQTLPLSNACERVTFGGGKFTNELDVVKALIQEETFVTNGAINLTLEEKADTVPELKMDADLAVWFSSSNVLEKALQEGQVDEMIMVTIDEKTGQLGRLVDLDDKVLMRHPQLERCVIALQTRAQLLDLLFDKKGSLLGNMGYVPLYALAPVLYDDLVFTIVGDSDTPLTVEAQDMEVNGVKQKTFKGTVSKGETLRLKGAGLTGKGTIRFVKGRSLGRNDSSWKMFDRRLGVFVHWGIYAVNGWQEQEEMRLNKTRQEYEKAIEGFNAAKFDARALVAAAKSAGATYLVVTAKHHDGFCLWNTKTTDFNATKAPAKRDLIGEIAKACREQGMKLGIYYSNPDWHHPNAYNPLSTHQLFSGPQPGDEPNMTNYLAYVKAQVTELCTNYGPLCCFFWDIPPHKDAPEMNELIRKLQPGIEINDRGWGPGDYSTPERSSAAGGAFARKTEACDSVDAESWGYRAHADYHTLGYLTRSIDTYLALGGNYLLNVGPKADGTLTAESAALLNGVGAWYAKTREAFEGVETVTNIVPDPKVIVTRKGTTTFVHYPQGLDRTGVKLGSKLGLPKKVTLLNTGAELKAEMTEMPSDYNVPSGPNRCPSLHVWGIPADELANEAVVLKLD